MGEGQKEEVQGQEREGQEKEKEKEEVVLQFLQFKFFQLSWASGAPCGHRARVHFRRGGFPKARDADERRGARLPPVCTAKDVNKGQKRTSRSSWQRSDRAAAFRARGVEMLPRSDSLWCQIP